MARLPTAADIGRQPAPSATPGIKAPKIDYSPLGGGRTGGAAGAIGRGLQSIGVSFEQEAAHEIERNLLDFRLQTELDLEEQSRAMPEGGAGFTESWRQSYLDRAKTFVGEGYANIPSHLRPQIDAKLKQHEVALHERAKRGEWAERDRKTVDDLNVTLGRTRSAVEVNPDRLEEMWTEGKRLVDTSSLSPAAKHTTTRKYRETLEEAAATAIATGATDAAGYARAKEMLAPHRAERVTSKSVAEGIKREADGMAVIASGSGARFRVNADHASRFQGLITDLEAMGVEIKGDQSGGYAKRNIRGSNKPSEHSFGRAIDLNWNENQMGSSGGSLVDQIGADKLRELASKHGLKWGGDFKRRPDPMHFEVDRGASPASAPPVAGRSMVAYAGMGGSDAAPTAEDYTGPFQSLSVAKRRAIWGQAEAQFDKVKKGVESVIKKQMEVSSEGNLPPAPILDEIERQVKAIGDPMLAAQYDAMLQRAEITRAYQKAPPQAVEARVRELEGMAAQHGETPEMRAEVEHLKKLGASTQKWVNDDPMTWAHRTGINVPTGNVQAGSGSFRAAQDVGIAPVRLERLNFASAQIDTQLAYRMDQAKGVGSYYGQPPQVFTKIEREFLRDTLRTGGDGMLFVLGTISNAAARAGVEPADVMKEFSKDAPEVAVIGQAVVSGADPRILDTAAKALSWRVKQGEKFVSTIDKAQAVPDLAEYADVLATTPTKVDAVRATANLVYEYEARRQGKQQFDGELYKTVVRRLMGETELPDGTRYGGIGEQGNGWLEYRGWFGSQPKVMVPPEVKTDSFDDMVSAVRMQDFGDRPPLDGEGKPLTISQIRSASWVSIGPGRYALELKRDSDGTRVVATTPDRQTYVLDMRPILPTIQKRKPEIFRGYDGSQRAAE